MARAGERPLAEYRRKRTASRTPEPVPDRVPAAPRPRRGRPRFVVQEHHASSLHWDFRLEHDGVLASWALPKGVPVDPGRNHLAVQVEDHPLEYGSFEGTIPRGEYGAGAVTIWDRGRYTVEKWEPDEVMVVLDGERATGRYVLFRTGGNQWMIHRMDPAPAGWTPPPEGLRPMLATAGPLPTGRAPRTRAWAYEFKWDGYRAIVTVDGGRVHLSSRTDQDLTPSFPELRELGEALGSTSVVLDGELVAFDGDGRPDFGLLQHRLNVGGAHKVAALAGRTPVSLVVFDLLYVDGEALVDQPYRIRRRRLEQLHLSGPRWAVTPSFTDVDGEEVMRAARDAGLEGVVSKRVDSPYLPGRRSDAWVKTKFVRTVEVVIGGYTPGQGARRSTFGALLLGMHGEHGLEYVGRVGSGFTEAAQRDLTDRFRRLARKTSPFGVGPSAAEGRGASWVRPSLVGEVQFGAWTDDGRLRHPVWKGLRTDKRPAEVVRDGQ